MFSASSVLFVFNLLNRNDKSFHSTHPFFCFISLDVRFLLKIIRKILFQSSYVNKNYLWSNFCWMPRWGIIFTVCVRSFLKRTSVMWIKRFNTSHPQPITGAYLAKFKIGAKKKIFFWIFHTEYPLFFKKKY